LAAEVPCSLNDPSRAGASGDFDSLKSDLESLVERIILYVRCREIKEEQRSLLRVK
jgi:hypothetical protein